ncbi:MAG: TatD family hydrolase [Candidatus Nezhaarchaeota archaeon]|nr:TatD family hydrolase [Candidatus Nezhaarchaeota archaeon]
MRRGGPRFIDVHCHIHDEEFDGDRDAVVERALMRGVEIMVTSSLSAEELQKAIGLAERYSCIRVAAGFNPSNTYAYEAERLAEEVRRLKHRLVAIGEVGLDYLSIKGNEREKQRSIFNFWIDVASEMDLPIIVHSRSAGKYAVEMLVEEGCSRVLMHAFDGSSGWALKGASKGFFFSVPPSIVRSQQKVKLARALPLDNLMVESDAPVLAPQREERNEPSNVAVAAAKIAELKRKDPLEVSEVLYLNAKDFFKL